MSMETVVRQIYAQWIAAKEQARMECESRGLHNVAERYRRCDLFKGTERTVGELADVLTSPQGLEFCMRYHFPNMATFRLFKGREAEKYGVYIDAGAITLKNPEKAVLIGHTSATIYCDTLEKHVITLLHGAKAVVNASGWTVVRVQAEQGCSCIKSISGNAVII